MSNTDNKNLNKLYNIDNKNLNKIDFLFKQSIVDILQNGFLDKNPRPKYQDGTPAYTYSVNQVMRKYDLSKGEFPITTLRPIAWKSAIKELCWIYVDQTNSLDVLKEKYGITWWDSWDIGNGTIGFRYGDTVNYYNLIDNLIDGLKNDPFGRRHIMSLWDESSFKKETKGLKPCAFLTMWNVRPNNDGELLLDMTLIQRSGDFMCASGVGGVNEVQYAALQLMISQVCGYKPGIFVHFIQNEQIYNRHIDQANELLERESIYTQENNLPFLKINKDIKDFYDFTIDDFKMINYDTKKIREQNPQLKFELGI